MVSDAATLPDPNETVDAGSEDALSTPQSSSFDASSSPPAEDATAPSIDASDAAPLPPPFDGGPATWSALYAGYLGPGTVGHCGNSKCHATTQSGFACGTTADSCYAGLVAAGLVDTSAPASSRIADPNRTPLAWFGTGGTMPRDEAVTNREAAAAVAAWVEAGAPTQ